MDKIYIRGDYFKFAASTALTNIADGVRIVALPFLVASLTGNPITITLVTALSYVPAMLFGVAIGSIIDRGRANLFVMAAGVGQGLIYAILTLLAHFGMLTVSILFVLSFFLGFGKIVRDNAAQSVIPQIVPSCRLERANGGILSAERIGYDLVGPSLGGILFALLNALPFALNSVLMMLSALLAYSVRSVGVRDANVKLSAVTMGEIYSASVSGIRWLWNADLIRTIVFTGTCLTFLTLVWESILVLVALGPLSLTSKWYGLILAAGSVIGVVGAMIAPALINRYERRSLQIAVLTASGVSVVLLAAIPSPATLAFAWGCTGAAFSIWNVLSLTLRQRLVSSTMLARVNSANRSLSFTAVLSGTLCGGFLSRIYGVTAPLWIAGIGLATLAALFVLRTRVPQPTVVDSP